MFSSARFPGWRRPAALALLTLLGLLGAPVLGAGPAAATAPTPSPIGARTVDGRPQLTGPDVGSWTLAELGDHSATVLGDKNPDEQLWPASTIKILTAVALEPRLDPAKKIRATNAHAAVDGTKVGLLPGNDYTVDQLMHAMIMSSANDAALALADGVGGEKKALELMNDTAAHLGMRNTDARTLNGLDAEGQAFTTHDMVILAHAALENLDIMAIAQTLSYEFPGGKNAKGEIKPGYQIQNHTKIVGGYEGGLGLKNGYTIKARGSFIAVAKRGDRTLVATVLKATRDSRSVAKALLDWGFDNPDADSVGSIDLTDLAAPAVASATPAAPGEGSASPTPGAAAAGPARAGADLGGLLPIAAGAVAAVAGALLVLFVFRLTRPGGGRRAAGR